MINVETCSPDQLQTAFDDFIALIDKTGMYRAEETDGIGLARTVSSRNCLTEQRIDFDASRHRDESGLVVAYRYRLEERLTERLKEFPEAVLTLIDDDYEYDADSALWVDHRKALTFNVLEGHIGIESERIFGVEDLSMVAVPVLGGVPILSGEVDLETETEARSACNVSGLHVSELVLVSQPEDDEPKDEFERIMAASGQESSTVGSCVGQILAMLDILKP